MSFTETLDALGSWDLELAAETPADTLAQLGYFGHLVLIDGPVDVEASGNALLAAARYVGVCRAKANPDTFSRSGSGLRFWLGDEDGKGHTILTEISLTNATLVQVVSALLPPTVTVRTVHPQANPITRYSGKHVFQSRRDALALGLAPFGAEIRVNGDFTVDVGTPAQLYDTQLPLATKPSPMIVRKGIGSDVDLLAVSGKVETEGAVWDLSTGIRVMGQTVGSGDVPDTAFVLGAADAAGVDYVDPQGNPVKFIRLISASSETASSAPVTAALNLNRFNRETTAIRVTAENFEISGGFGVGDATFVYDPESGILDTANQVPFRGETVYPAIIRVTSLTTPIVEGMTVAWRTNAGVWLDLTRWVVWESAASREVTVGGIPRSLSKPSDPIQDRVDAARGGTSTKEPKAPADLSLTTSSTVTSKGANAAVIASSWSAVTQYVDNTTVALSHYEVQLRPVFRAPLWQAGQITSATSADLPATPALAYDVRVRAWSTGGVPSAWSATASITAAADSAAPNPPADPLVTSYLGQLRIEYVGTDSSGNPMASDTNRIDVHVGTTAGFTATDATRVSSLTPQAKGVAYATAPYGSARYVRLIAVDHAGNPSASSAVVSGTTVQAGDGDIAALSVGKLTAGIMTADVTVSGRFATALTGARREMNAVGFQGWDASNNLTISLDGVNNLLTGLYRTGLTGTRRIEMGAAGASGRIDFFAPDGSQAYISANTATAGAPGSEYIEMRAVPSDTATIHPSWSSYQISENTDHFQHGRNIKLAFSGDPSSAALGIYLDYAPDKGSPGSTGVPPVAPTRHRRMAVLKDFTSMYLSPTGTFTIFQWPTGANMDDQTTALNRFRITPTTASFRIPDLGGNARIEVLTSSIGSNGAASPSLKFATTPWPTDGVTYGIAVKGYRDGSGARLEVRDVTDTGFADIWAAEFAVHSDRAVKSDIEDYGPGALKALRTARVRRYQIDESGRAEDGKTPPKKRDRIGLVAQEAPADVKLGDETGEMAINLYALTSLNTAAIQELADQIDEIKRGSKR